MAQTIMANTYAAEKLAIRAELEAARCDVRVEVRALSATIRARREDWQRTTVGPVKALLTVAGGWLAYRALMHRRVPAVPLGLLALRWIRPRLTTWLLRRV